jgi:hypothetical protein
MTDRTDESGELPALDDEDDVNDGARERARVAIVRADVLDLADEAMTRVGEIVTVLREELEDERGCTRMLRGEVAKRDVENAELRAENEELRRALSRKDARLAKTA